MMRWREWPGLLLGAWLAAAGAGAADTAMQARKVAPHVWFVQGEAAMGSAANRNFISNAGFVVTGGGVVVIDALGSPALAEGLIAEIRRVTREPIRYVVVTHYHAEHICGLQAFKAAGATIIAHAAGRAYISSDTARARLEASRRDLFLWVDEKKQVVSADRLIEGDEADLRVGSFDFRLRHVGPARTTEDLAVHVPQLGVLFAGDLSFQVRIPFVGQADRGQWVQSLERMLEFKPRLVITGHGPPSTDALADLALTRDYLLHLRKTMGDAARDLEPFDEAYARADGSRFERLPLFGAVNRMNAYNTYLLMEQQQGKR